MKKATYLFALFAAAFFTSCEKYSSTPTSPTSVVNTSAGSVNGNIYTIAGNGTWGFSGDGGSAISAELNTPTGVAVDASGNVYIADYENFRIRKVNTVGVISTFAGGDTIGLGDGGPATKAGLYLPAGLAIDLSGNLYIADKGDERIRMVNTSGIISTIAGNGTGGYSGDGGNAIAAELYDPYAIAIDVSGNIYIADAGNNRIRKVNTSGIISTFAGNGTQGYSGDSVQATTTELYAPRGLALDGSGNLYIADAGNNRIRKVNTSGIISTFAGSSAGGFSGDGGPATSAELDAPVAVTVDGSGNIYIADLSSRIRMVNTSGIILTVAGNEWVGYSGDGGAATSAKLNNSYGVAVDNWGNIYIADTYNYRIRKVYK